MKSYTFDAWIFVEAESKDAAADIILEQVIDGDIGLGVTLFEEGTLNTSNSADRIEELEAALHAIKSCGSKAQAH